jgi:hypothetical protein
MPMTLSLRGFAAKTAHAYSVTADSYAAPWPGSARLAKSAVVFDAAPMSITTIELRR